MITRRLYVAIAAAMATAAAAVTLVLSAVPVALAVALLVLLGILACLAIVTAPNAAALWTDLAGEDRAIMVRALCMAAFAHTTWASLVVLRPGLWLAWAGTLALLAAIEAAAAKALLHTVQRRTAARPHSQATAAQVRAIEASRIHPGGTALARVESDPADPRQLMRRALVMGGRSDVEVMTGEAIHNGDQAIGMRFRVRIDVTTTRKGKSGGTPRMSGADIEPLAIALSRLLGIELASDWVQITKQAGAGVYVITVTVVDALAVVYPFVDPRRWLSIKDPMPIAREIDGTYHHEPLTVHWADTGQTRSGKTSLVQVKWALITLCRDAVLWVGGTEKLFDAVGPWIAPYRGTDHRVPMDWIANDGVDSLEMLIAAMTVARMRQATPHEDRGDFVTLIVQIDEASFFLVMNHILGNFEGASVTPTLMAEMIVKGAGSAGVWLHLVSQRGTGDNWGDRGPAINANVSVQTVFRTGDTDEIGRATGDYKLPNPTHKGQFLMRPAEGEVKSLKAEYIQETDPTKPTLHDGDTLTDIAWARRDFHTALDPRSAATAGAAYANRHTRADDLWAYLLGQPTGTATPAPATTTSTTTTGGQTDPTFQAGLDAAGELMAELLADYVATAPQEDGQDIEDAVLVDEPPTSQAAPVPPTTGSVIDMSTHRPRPERIVEILLAAVPDPLPLSEIIARLVAAGDHAAAKSNGQSVTNALRDLVATGRVTRLDRGIYKAA